LLFFYSQRGIVYKKMLDYVIKNDSHINKMITWNHYLKFKHLSNGTNQGQVCEQNIKCNC
jgi:hypothetical protein